MRRNEIVIITVITLVILLLVVYQYVISIYEVSYSVNPPHLFADSRSTTTVAAVPLNSFGKEAPFRSVSVKFEIKEGEELIDIVSQDESEGFIILRAKDRDGLVVIIARSEKALLPSLIEINVLPVLASE